MNKAEYLNKIQQKIFYAKKHFISLKEPIETAESLIVKGFMENKINNPYTQNGLKILSSFIANENIRETLKLLEIAMKENN